MNIEPIALAKSVVYFTPMFGHIHESPHVVSGSLTTISCGFPLTLLKSDESTQKFQRRDWQKVQGGDAKGFVMEKYLSKSKPKCFQSEFPQFYNGLNLDLSTLHYWGRIIDQIITVEIEP